MSFVKENLYIGSRADAIALANTRPSEEKTRILTVDLEPLRLENEDLMILKHVQCLDEHDSDLLSFFDDCSEFITDGIDKKENVLVHCPNDGFVVQLQLYEAMGNTVDKTNPAYKEYRLKLLANQLQSQQYGSKDLLSSVIKELKDTSSSAHKSYKCRKCRLLLFDTNSVLAHEPGSGQTSFKWQKQDLHKVDPKINTQCTSVFIEPVTWMLPLLEGTVDGKLLCPKCNGRLGSFNWAGMQCSCGKWVTPAFQIHKNRVDEVSHQLAPS
ncbi:dual specificity protein phosphatase 12-like isoform X4 [Acropora millepora]|uniref:dual specificity protein phosphatase 12-like isoform X4 n=1 Tax=Acropora millepora TaxID=45264 RepID=UPI001CF0EF32|nr:dual specificity protein phosphatase 12-like isoform X4 [Acropora millepora]